MGILKFMVNRWKPITVEVITPRSANLPQVVLVTMSQASVASFYYRATVTAFWLAICSLSYPLGR